MTLTGLFTGLALASSALAIPLYGRDKNTSGINWGPCDFESATSGPIECATLDVPLDYTDPASSETLALSLIKSPSRSNTTTVKKSILFNFGGPGYGAVSSLNSGADVFHMMTGGQHDLIAFDPRGTEKTITFSCFDTPTERLVASFKFPYLPVDAHDSALAETFAGAQATANICRKKYAGNHNPEFIGTAFVARDLMSVVDALGEDGLLRFWGLSYGTVLGMTVAAMFPDRMDRLVLDGVVNAHNYYHHFGIDIDQFLTADSGFRAILSACIEAGPAKCPLASINSTAADLEATLFGVAEKYGKEPVAVGTSVLTERLVKEMIFVVTKYTSGIATATNHLANLITGTNLTEVVAYYDGLAGGIAVESDAISGIKCSDTFPRVDSVEGILPDVEHMLATSELFAPLLAGVAAQCATWPWAAKERYGGPWEGIKTKNPILFFGNTYDPATPLASAKNMSLGFEGSVVVEQHGFGHATPSQLSNCTTKIMSEYFNLGTLPADGTVCEVNDSLF
ncbi:TAP-like protein-domain-containing protein [Chaetomium sp. MPI-CAGE-AT-0009]|nr:TAP-like protein-domain-containing protein [Chaetomium sp. MPI-CAGE-AT-0009]